MKKRSVYILLFIIVLAFRSIAGELDDLLRLNKTYASDNLSLEFKLDVNYNDKKKETYNGKYMKNRKGFFYSVIHIESFSDNMNSVVVDKSQKLLIVGNSLSSENVGKELRDMLGQFKFDSSSVKNLYHLKYMPAGDKIRKIEMKPKDESGEFESVEITIHEDYTMSEVRYVYRKTGAKNRITDYTITYTSQKTTGDVVIPVKLSKYIVQSGKKIALQKAYEGYKLIDNRIKTK